MNITKNILNSSKNWNYFSQNIHNKFAIFVTILRKEFIKVDLTDHVLSPWNVSQNKIPPYAVCMEKRNSNQQDYLHNKREKLTNSKKPSVTKHSPPTYVYSMENYRIFKNWISFNCKTLLYQKKWKMKQNLRNRRFIQNCAQNAGSNVLKFFKGYVLTIGKIITIWQK